MRGPSSPRSGRPPKGLPADADPDLVAYIRHLEYTLAAMDDEQQALDGLLAQMRSCGDHHCLLCRHCVTALFLRIKPAPLALPKRYVESPWRR